MGGQVLGGGVIVLVCVLLWLVYLLPSWASRYRYDAAERNAVRLNQALRILAETSETPAEVRLELNARTAYTQQKLARRAQAELDERERRAQAERDELARRSLAAREDLATRTQTRLDELARRALQEREAARLEEARRSLLAARSLPAARQARARRRARLVATVIGLTAIALIAVGVFILIQTGAQLLLWVGGALVGLTAVLLRRMSRVGARAVVQDAPASVAVHEPLAVQDVALVSDRRPWAPRSLPAPLTASAGSQASAVLDAEEARRALRQAAREDALRARAESQRPPSIDTARRARQEAALVGAGHDDAAIEAHVRQLLERRASGQ